MSSRALMQPCNSQAAEKCLATVAAKSERIMKKRQVFFNTTYFRYGKNMLNIGLKMLWVLC